MVEEWAQEDPGKMLTRVTSDLLLWFRDTEQFCPLCGDTLLHRPHLNVSEVPLLVVGDVCWSTVDAGLVTGCPAAGMGTADITGPFSPSSFPFTYGEGIWRGEGVAVVGYNSFSFHLICQQAQRGEDPVLASCL